MTQLNDAMYDVLKVAVPPARNLNDMIADWLVANGATGGAIPDLWDQFFDARDIGVPNLGNELFDMEALSAEEVDNSNFENWTDDDPDDWDVVNAGNGRHITQVGNDSARLINDGSGIFYIRQDFMTAGVLYKVTLVVDAVDLDNIFVWEGGGSGNIFETDEVGTFTAYYLSVAGGRLIVGKSSSTATFDVTIGSVSFKEVVQGDRRITPPDVWPQLAGPELIEDPNLGSDILSKGDGWTYDDINDKYDCDGSQTLNTRLRQLGLTFIANRMVRFEFMIENYSAGNIRPIIHGGVTVNGTYVNSNGTYVEYLFNADASNVVATMDGDSDFIGSISYFSVREVQLSWVPYSTNIMELDVVEDALKITYVDNTAGGRINFGDVDDLSSDLVVGEQYLVTFEAKCVKVAGDVLASIDLVVDIDSSPLTADWETYQLSFTAENTGSDRLDFKGLSAGEEVWIRNLSIKEVVWTGDRNDRAYEWLQSIGMDTIDDELTTNGDFANWTLDDPDGWIVNGEVGSDPMITEVAGACRVYTSGNFINLYQIILTDGKLYKCTLDVDTVVSGSIRVETQVTHAEFSTTGHKEFYFEAVGGAFYISRNSSGQQNDITFDNVSVKEVSGSHINDMWYNFWTSGAVVPAYLNMQEVVLFLVDEGWDATLSLRELQVTVESDVYTVGKKDLLVSKKKPDHVKLPNALKRGIKNALAAQGF